MEFRKFSFHAAGCEIFTRHIAPDTVKGVVVLVHGMGEHSGRYIGSVIPLLLAAEFAVVTYDNVGHGKSSGRRGHCPGYEALMDILESAIARAEALYPRVSLFLYGHSMGGNLVLNFAIRNQLQIAGVLATSPYLRLAFKPAAWKMSLGKLLLRGLPMITMPSGLDPKGISRIPEEVGRYLKDPLVHDMVSPMFSFPVMDAGEWAIKNANRLQTATLLLHGTGDPIIDYRATEEFHENSGNTSLRLFENGYHELHHDLCKEAVFTTVVQWLQERIV